MIARDKNHPCVVIWSIANEPESDTSQARAYFEPLAAETRRLDPTRPAGFVNVMLAPASKDVVADLFDVVAAPLARAVLTGRDPCGGASVAVTVMADVKVSAIVVSSAIR